MRAQAKDVDKEEGRKEKILEAELNRLMRKRNCWIF